MLIFLMIVSILVTIFGIVLVVGAFVAGYNLNRDVLFAGIGVIIYGLLNFFLFKELQTMKNKIAAMEEYLDIEYDD